jgi:hypothetical protein
MAEAGIMEGFKVTLVVMLFYSLSINLLVYAIPANARHYVTAFSQNTNTYDIESIGEEVQGGLTKQSNIPIIEAGALVFYSGNFLIDLILNFLYAIPQMFGYLIFAITTLFNLDHFIVAAVQLFASVLITVLYMVGLIQLLTGIRSGRIV